MQGMPYGVETEVNGVRLSFHPAGHIIGSAQVRLEYKGEVWVVSGDYKIEEDGFSEAFEPVKCNVFITESTFALPIYRWKPQAVVMDEINSWWAVNASLGMVSVIQAYSLGKAQRLVANLDHSIGKIYCDGPVDGMNKALRASGIQLQETCSVTPRTIYNDLKGSMVIASTMRHDDLWMSQSDNVEVAQVSGWMQTHRMRRSRGRGRAFTLSDHADWPGLNKAIEATGANRVFVTHGFEKQYSRYLRECGLEAGILKTSFGEDED